MSVSSTKWRRTREYRVWRYLVISRDKRCVICGSVRHRQAHHINHASYFKNLRFDPSNGVTLCADCHSQFHNNFKLSTRAKCTYKDWKNFKDLYKYFKNILTFK